MAEMLDDGTFWLPSEFLTDDDLFVDFKTADSFTKKRGHDFSFGLDNSFPPFNSDLYSPVVSAGGSTKTESDEDDFVAGLARKIANSTLRQSDFYSDHAFNGRNFSGVCKPAGSGCGIPNCASPEYRKPVGSELPCTPAEEIARMGMIAETTAFYSTKLFCPTQKPGPFTAPLKNPNTAAGFYPNHNERDISYVQLRVRQLQLLNQQQMMSRVLGQRRMGYQFQNEAGRTTSSPLMATWPTLQQSQQLKQQPGSGTRTVFLGGTGAKKDRTGTGVFIPGRYGTNPTQTRKKPGCSVLLPDRVVQALNMNLDSIDTPCKLTTNHTTEYDAVLRRRNLAIMAQQRRNMRTKQPLMNQELRLPQEWTY